MDIENRVTIITGATGGLGQVVAKIFAERGARLVLVGTNEAKLQQLVGELNLAENRLLGLIADVTQPAASKEIVEKVLAKFGRIDILLHLVSGWSGEKPVVDVDDEQVEYMLQQHLWTTYHLAQSIIPAMAANRWGRILVISSPVASPPRWI